MKRDACGVKIGNINNKTDNTRNQRIVVVYTRRGKESWELGDSGDTLREKRSSTHHV
jgi:hypothetical protein